MAERGEIRNHDCRRQIADFTRLRWGAITPTDIDGFIDFGGRLFVFFEGKHGDTAVPYGQQLALARLCDACTTLKAVGFIVSHQTPADAAIDYSQALVRKYRWNRTWIVPRASTTLLQGIERIRSEVLKGADWIADYEREEAVCWGEKS